MIGYCSAISGMQEQKLERVHSRHSRYACVILLECVGGMRERETDIGTLSQNSTHLLLWGTKYSRNGVVCQAR